MACGAAHHGVDDGSNRRFGKLWQAVSERRGNRPSRFVCFSMHSRCTMWCSAYPAFLTSVLATLFLAGGHQGGRAGCRGGSDSQAGQKPIVVGMSRWSVASALSFYNKEEPMDIRSRNMFGQNAAMYDFWYPSEPPTTRPIILVGMKPHQLEHDIAGVDDITPALVQPGPVKELTIMRDGKPLRKVYYRVAQRVFRHPRNQVHCRAC